MFSVIILDYGHGGFIDGVYQTSGKQYHHTDADPVLSLYEGESNRKTAARLIRLLLKAGIPVEDCVARRGWAKAPGSWLDLEQRDTSLSSRTTYANGVATLHGPERCLLISLHSNAVGNTSRGPSQSARGVDVYTSRGQTGADPVATALHAALSARLPQRGLSVRKGDLSDGDPDREADFWMVRRSSMPAVLLESGFFTNLADARFLASDDGQDALAGAIFAGLKPLFLPGDAGSPDGVAEASPTPRRHDPRPEDPMRFTEEQASILDRLRAAWMAERDNPGAVRARVSEFVARVCEKLSYKRHVRDTIRRLWRENVPHWTAVFEDHLEERKEEGYEEGEAERLATEDLKVEFFTTLEARLAQELDNRVVWAFIGNPAWRAILEQHDGRLFLRLVKGLRATLKLLERRVPQLTVAEDVVTAAVTDLLSSLAEKTEAPAAERKKIPRPHLSEEVVRMPAGQPLDVSWQTIHEEPTAELDEPDTEEEDEEESPTVVAPEPSPLPAADPPSRAPFPVPDPGEVEEESSAKAALSRLQGLARARLNRGEG